MELISPDTGPFQLTNCCYEEPVSSGYLQPRPGQRWEECFSDPKGFLLRGFDPK